MRRQAERRDARSKRKLEKEGRADRKYAFSLEIVGETLFAVKTPYIIVSSPNCPDPGWFNPPKSWG